MFSKFMRLIAFFFHYLCFVRALRHFLRYFVIRSLLGVAFSQAHPLVQPFEYPSSSSHIFALENMSREYWFW